MEIIKCASCGVDNLDTVSTCRKCFKPFVVANDDASSSLLSGVLNRGLDWLCKDLTNVLKFLAVFFLILSVTPSVVSFYFRSEPTPSISSAVSTPVSNQNGSIKGRADFVNQVNSLDPSAKITFAVSGAQNEILILDATNSRTTSCQEMDGASEVKMRPKYKSLGFARVVYMCVDGRRDVDLS
jgi:hypothetical protein